MKNNFKPVLFNHDGIFVLCWEDSNPEGTGYYNRVISKDEAKKILMGPCFGFAAWAAETLTQ